MDPSLKCFIFRQFPERVASWFEFVGKTNSPMIKAKNIEVGLRTESIFLPHRPKFIEMGLTQMGNAGIGWTDVREGHLGTAPGRSKGWRW